MQAWTKEELMELMINETLLTFYKIMVNVHNHHNLLKKWEDVIGTKNG
jgi:hypothetical protein